MLYQVSNENSRVVLSGWSYATWQDLFSHAAYSLSPDSMLLKFATQRMSIDILFDLIAITCKFKMHLLRETYETELIKRISSANALKIFQFSLSLQVDSNLPYSRLVYVCFKFVLHSIPDLIPVSLERNAGSKAALDYFSDIINTCIVKLLWYYEAYKRI